MGWNRRVKLDTRQKVALQTRKTNKGQKDKERARRDARMLQTVRSGSLPYTPAVMSWLSTKLGKKASKIVAEDIAGLTS